MSTARKFAAVITGFTVLSLASAASHAAPGFITKDTAAPAWAAALGGQPQDTNWAGADDTNW